MVVAATTTDAALAASMASLKQSIERMKEIAERSKSTDATLARIPRLQASWEPREQVVQVTTTTTPLAATPTVASLNLSLGREATSSMGAHKVFDGKSERQEETSSHVLHVTITSVLQPVTEKVIHQVFDPYGVNEICVLQETTHVKAFVEFQSWREASKARGGLHGRCIYDGCCFLDIQHAPPSIGIHRLPNSEPVMVDWHRVEVEPLTSSHPSVATPTPISTAMPISGERVVQVSEGVGHVAAMASNTDTACTYMLPTEPQTDYKPQDKYEPVVNSTEDSEIDRTKRLFLGSTFQIVEAICSERPSPWPSWRYYWCGELMEFQSASRTVQQKHGGIDINYGCKDFIFLLGCMDVGIINSCWLHLILSWKTPQLISLCCVDTTYTGEPKGVVNVGAKYSQHTGRTSVSVVDHDHNATVFVVISELILSLKGQQGLVLLIDREPQVVHWIGIMSAVTCVEVLDANVQWDPGGFLSTMSGEHELARQPQCQSGNGKFLQPEHAIAWGQAMFCRGGSVTPGPRLHMRDGLLRWARPNRSAWESEG